MTSATATEGHGSLAPARLRDYERDGFLVIRGMYSAPEMAELSRWCDELAGRPEVPGRHMVYYEDSVTEPGRRVLARIENFCPFHPGLAGLLDGGRARAIASELLGESAFLFKDKINFKMPGGQGFKAHQDVQAGWSDYAALQLTMLVSIDAATLDNGCLELAAGCHREGLLGSMWAPLAEDDAGVDYVPCPAAPGDVVFFDSFVPHRSGPNLSDSQRRVLYVTYNRASEGDSRARYFEDKRKNYPPDCERVPGREYVFKV